jgi:hypothetical protein
VITFGDQSIELHGIARIIFTDGAVRNVVGICAARSPTT